MRNSDDQSSNSENSVAPDGGNPPEGKRTSLLASLVREVLDDVLPGRRITHQSTETIQ